MTLIHFRDSDMMVTVDSGEDFGSVSCASKTGQESTDDWSFPIPSKNSGCCQHHNDCQIRSLRIIGKGSRVFIYDGRQNAVLPKRLDQLNKDSDGQISES
jgi:hypothetical protein